MVFLCAMFLVFSITGVVGAVPTYVDGVTALTGWYDVSQGTSEMCWAATASNVLAYTGWDGGFANADAIFSYYQGHWQDDFGNTWPAIRWFFDGVDDTTYGPARVTTPGGDFYSWSYFDSNVGAYQDPADAWTAITDYVGRSHDAIPDNEAGLYIFLDDPDEMFDHWVTVWGYDTDGGNKIVITDSFYNANSLDTYTVSLSGGEWILDGAYSGYSIGTVSRLNLNFEGIPPKTVPEPSTLLLLGSGLIGIVVLRKKAKM